LVSELQADAKEAGQHGPAAAAGDVVLPSDVIRRLQV